MMQAVILAAGNSTRTYPLTVKRAKPLLKIANKMIIEHTLDSIKEIVDDAIIIYGSKSTEIKKILGETYGKIKLTYIEQKVHDGTGSAVTLAKDFLKDKFIVMNGDDLFSEKDIKKCVDHKACILVKEVDELYRFGEAVIEDDKLKALVEKPDKKHGLANTGLYVFDKRIFEHNLKKSKRGEYEITDYISYMIEKYEINFEVVEDYWIPISYPWNVLEANEFFLKNIKKDIQGEVEKGAVLKGPVKVGKGTLIRSGVYIEGPVVIGEDCVIGPNCFIRKYTSIADGSKVGNAVEVKNSVIGESTSIGHLSYIGDSVIGNKVNLGAGTITANLRHDDENIKTPVKGSLVDTGRRKLGAIIGDNVHTGINTSIYPGRKIWPDKTTLPGEIVKEDIR